MFRSRKYKYASLSPNFNVFDMDGPVSCFCRKARRKDRESLGSEDPKLYLEQAVLDRRVPDIDLKVLVEAPPGICHNEWLASHTIAFFDHINLIYGTISEFCTALDCPEMTGPGVRTYLWFDEKGKKTKVAAPQYIDYVMTFTQKTISDESIFPTKYANDFPSSFESIVRKILRLLFHVLAHIYHSHFREVVLLNMHPDLNCIFAHFILFNARYQLIEVRETETLQDLVVALKILDNCESDQTESMEIGSTVSTSNVTQASIDEPHRQSQTMLEVSATATSNIMFPDSSLSLSAFSSSNNQDVLSTQIGVGH
ncbi:MOB kinase activator-like 2 isoform X2 [Bemisia tabaci]|uniref:MOB kinase activator-like 2 isoform X2 n=1 Tax=Bemisia tabaci TaxID=7038 RepID=UPI0008F9ACF9|nr:PREDICTED: MOB kinase activator-like 2 isoform X2 [Bemisia tabaci]